MKRKSFFEYLGLADMEKMHSQILAWMLSENCSLLTVAQKTKLLQHMIGGKVVGDIKNIYTEHKNIDILIETDTEWIVIENKLKSSQHSNQLKKYEGLVGETIPQKDGHYVFLTLSQERAKKPWINFSYKELVKIISGLKLNLNSSTDGLIFSEYFSFLIKLTETVNIFLGNPKACKNVFTDGHLSKFEKSKLQYDDPAKFISENQLETILQKCYLAPIVDQLAAIHADIDFSVSDTRGVALIDAFFKEDFVFEDRAYKLGIQYQGGTWKFALSIASNYSESKKDWIKTILPLFKEFKSQKRFGYTQYNGPDTKAWVSVSKKMKKEIFDITIHEFVMEYSQELKHCKALKDEILKNI